MDRTIPMSRINQISLFMSLLSGLLSLIIQEWAGLTPVPFFMTILWVIFVIIMSTWISCYLLRLTLKANVSVNIEFMNKWFYSTLQDRINYFDKSICNSSINGTNIKKENKNKNKNKKLEEKLITKSKKLGRITQQKKLKENDTELCQKSKVFINNISKEILKKYVDVWYKDISDDRLFLEETERLLNKLLKKICQEIQCIDNVKLTNKIADVLLLHFKEYRRALRRVEKGISSSIEDAYKYLHPGSRNSTVLEHSLHKLVTILAQEFLQWELTSSLPCKMLLSILAKRLLIIIEAISTPNFIFSNLLGLLQCTQEEKNEIHSSKNLPNTVVTTALSDGITSVTAAVIPRPLPASNINSEPTTILTCENKNSNSTSAPETPSLCLENSVIEHRGLWGHSEISEVDSEMDEDRISPVYEEPTDFATTIARLRNVLQQKSTATTPLQPEEKSYVIYEGCQFTNLSIPWTEFHTAADGSQQLLYCIQFDDIEQHGEDLFETTTATVRRQYVDFIQLHAALEEISSIASIMSELVLPEGGRVEMETYLRTLCTRLSTECPPQLRHFLRPNSGGSKKADAVAPRFDRFLAKTVSGVFNTLKTVVPGFEMDQEEEVLPLPTLMPLADIPWRFVENSKSKCLSRELQHLLDEKADYCSVDTAYEAVDTTDASGDVELTSYWWERVDSSYDEELDELDSTLPLTCRIIDIICELLAGIGSDNTFQQEAVVRWFKLLFGNITEPFIQNTILWLFNGSWELSFGHTVMNDVTTESIESKKKMILKILEAKIPYDIKLIFGKNEVQKILKYLLDLCEVKKINTDLNICILDSIISHLLISCTVSQNNLSPR